MSKTIGKPLYKKWWFWLLLLAVLGNIGKLGEDKPAQETVAVKQETSKQEAPIQQEQPQPAATKTQSNNDGSDSQLVTTNPTPAQPTQATSEFVNLKGRGTSDEGRSEPHYEG
ncbi:hypothetical protein P9578_24055 [Brevibacillus choshinensis]|uniref:hypothetical protein n=1 Tax=Brevibacillus choshinensis TaxID=54911 RepID=UPI002E1D0645|nr:hypothetical protein [Brevibacillus choshinensis]